MRISITSVLLVAWGASAAAADPCAVTIARAPAELRVAVELRAVPSEGGYYLLARDMHGRVRERITTRARGSKHA